MYYIFLLFKGFHYYYYLFFFVCVIEFERPYYTPRPSLGLNPPLNKHFRCSRGFQVRGLYRDVYSEV
jgi:hypothetical protein